MSVDTGFINVTHTQTVLLQVAQTSGHKVSLEAQGRFPVCSQTLIQRKTMVGVNLLFPPLLSSLHPTRCAELPAGVSQHWKTTK